MSALDSLLALQEHDLALDRLRHRLSTLAERAALHEAESRAALLRSDLDAQRTALAEVTRRERALEDEAQSLAVQAAAVEKKLYSGQIASPRELQALQADAEQLRRHQRGVEERAIDVMEEREPLDAAVVALDADIAACDQVASDLRAVVAGLEAEIAEEVRAEGLARAERQSALDPALVTDYEQRRMQNRGIGAARLVGNTCQGCRLSIPATEVDRIRHGAGEAVAFCDNCGCILVP